MAKKEATIFNSTMCPDDVCLLQMTFDISDGQLGSEIFHMANLVARYFIWPTW